MESSEDVKKRLLNAWHNLKYGKTAFNSGSSNKQVQLSTDRSPVVLLGEIYHGSNSEKSFHADFRSKLWFTYRRQFEQFAGTSITSDCGWGCTVRSGQMLLANCILTQKLGRTWRFSQIQEDALHRKIISLFTEDQNASCSIHKLIQLAGSLLGKKPGDWFGPSSTAYLLKEAVEVGRSELLSNICVYVGRDCTVYKADVRKEAKKVRRSRKTRKSSSNCSSFAILESSSVYPMPDSQLDLSPRFFGGVIDGVPYYEEAVEAAQGYSLNQQISVDGQTWIAEGHSNAKEPFNRQQDDVEDDEDEEECDWTPVLILIPVRLGTDKLNPVYIPSLQAMLASESCVGVIGGRPRHSLYFVGFQDDDLIHLDPHLVQDAVVKDPRGFFPPESFHCNSPRKMNASKMDPSCCLGFFCPTEANFEAWCELVKTLAVPPESDSDYPLFSICENSIEDYRKSAEASDMSLSDHESLLRSSLTDGDELTEEFVFL